MDSTDMIIAVPWLVFVAGLVAVAWRLSVSRPRRKRRAALPPASSTRPYGGRADPPSASQKPKAGKAPGA
jgi:hypothetical protein